MKITHKFYENFQNKSFNEGPVESIELSSRSTASIYSLFSQEYFEIASLQYNSSFGIITCFTGLQECMYAQLSGF